jgi:hypothetical protein
MLTKIYLVRIKMETKTPKTFGQMTRKQLRAFIAGCHLGRAYGPDFDAACREENARIDSQSERELEDMELAKAITGFYTERTQRIKVRLLPAGFSINKLLSKQGSNNMKTTTPTPNNSRIIAAALLSKLTHYQSELTRHRSNARVRRLLSRLKAAGLGV